MNTQPFTIVSPKNDDITIDVTPGHFTTSSAHTSHYLDVSKLKYDARIARQVAHEFAIPHLAKTIVDTIVCIEDTQVLGAYLAEELLQEGFYIINTDRDISVVSPDSNVNGQLIFHKGVKELIDGKKIMLLLATVSTGKSLWRALECLNYYGGELVGVSALFSTEPEVYGQEIFTVFSSKDIPEYHHASPANCPLCKAGTPLDAIVSAGGYTKL